MHFSLSTPFLFLAVLPIAAAQTEPPPDQPVKLDPVVVNAQLDQAREDIVPSLGAVDYAISRQQIDALPGGANLGFNQVLLQAPGVAQDSFGQVHLRGEHANLQYRVNDVLLPEGISGFGQELDTPFIQSVSLLTGALPAQYGYRTAGVVDIHTRSADSAGGTGDVSLYGGSFSALRASWEESGSAGALRAYATASAETTAQGIENPTASHDPLHDHSRDEKVFADTSDVVNDTSRLSLLLSASYATYQIPDVPGQAPVFALTGVPTFDSARLDENQRQSNAYAIAAYQHSGEAFDAQISAFGRTSDVVFAPDTVGDLVFNGVASSVHRAIVGGGAEADFRWSLGDHTLRAGAIANATTAGTRTATAVFPADADGNQTGDVPFTLADHQRKSGALIGGYVQDEWKPVADLTVNGGFRLDASQGYLNEGQLSPRLNIVYQFGGGTSAHVGYARYFTPPPLELIAGSTVTEFAGTTNQPEVSASSPVRSERANYYDAGVSHAFPFGLTLGADGYIKRASNGLDEGQFGPALIFSPFNYQKVDIDGLELTSNYTKGGFTAYGNLALSRAMGRQITSGEFFFSPDELAYIATQDIHLDHDQALTASAGVSYRWDDWLVSGDFLYGSGLRRGFANTDHLPEYHPVNLGVERRFHLSGHKEIRVRIDVVNVGDEVYEIRDGTGVGVGAPQYGSRRGISGGLTYVY